MKHASEQALGALAPLLADIRRIDGLREPKRGTFYRRASAFLHFHEDPAGFFADLKIAGGFERFPVNTPQEHATLIAAARAEVTAAASPTTLTARSGAKGRSRARR